MRDVIDNSGGVLGHIQYDSFGKILSQSYAADAMRQIWSSRSERPSLAGDMNFKTTFEIDFR